MHQARIKLTGTDPEKLAYVCDQLKKIAENLRMEKEKLPGKNGNLEFINV